MRDMNRTEKERSGTIGNESRSVPARSNTELLCEIEAMLETMPAETLDMDRLEADLEQLQARAPVAGECDAGDFWERMVNTYPLVIGTGSASSDGATAQPRRRHIRGMLRMMLVAAAVVAMLLIGTLTAQAFGFDLWGAVARWSEETFTFDRGEPREDSGLAATLRENGIQEALVPTWIPDRYQLTNVAVEETPAYTSYTAYYRSEEGNFQIKISEMEAEVYATYEKDQREGNIYMAGGIEHYIMNNLENLRTVWLKDAYQCTISGDLTLEEMKKMIDSIY